MTLFNRAIVLVLALSITLLAITASLSPARAQQPPPLDKVPVIQMPPVDNQKLLQQDRQRASQEQPERFAHPIAVHITAATHGIWEQPAPDLRRWRVRVSSPGAVSLNLGFGRYVMPPGGHLRISTPDERHTVGPFTSADNAAHGQLWTPLLPGDEVVLAVSLPADAAARLQLELTTINHGYVEFSAPPIEKSGACHVDVTCPQGDPWRNQARAVAVYSVGGFHVCGGSLVNNTAYDRTPYFLTAAHCGITAENAPSVVAYWNYVNPTCRPPGSAESGSPGDGTLDQFSSGAILRATYEPSDMTLLELDAPVDPAFDPYWAGWDATAADPASAVTIHHPGAEEKRISVENDAVTTTSYGGIQIPGDGTHLRVSDWELGTTERGSSGAPLFNQDGRIVGQLHGGFANCDNNLSDWYGRLSASWNGGGTPESSLQPWLDPLGSGTAVLDGRAAADVTLQITPATREVCIADEPVEATYAIEVAPAGAGEEPITLTVAGQPPDTSATLSPATVTAPGSSTLAFGDLESASPGSYTIQVQGSDTAAPAEAIAQLTLASALPDSAALLEPASDSTGVDIAPELTWTAAPQAAAYLVEIAEDDDFSSTIYTATISDTGMTSRVVHPVATLLESDTRYYWRVTAINSCGSGEPSAVASFTTERMLCSAPALPIPNNTVGGITDSMEVFSDTGDMVIGDLDVLIVASHSYVSDLAFSLEHSGTEQSATRTPPLATLIDQPGIPATASGCIGADIAVLLDDEALHPVEDSCNTDTPGTPAVSGHLSPVEPLSVFDGQPFDGTWSLHATDIQPLDSGTLDRWCLIPTLHPPAAAELALSKAVSDPQPQPGQVVSYTITVTNTGSADAADLFITDTLPPELWLAGPISLQHDTLTPKTGAAPPRSGQMLVLASNLQLAAGERIAINMPVTVQSGLRAGTVITNRVTVSSSDLPAPVADSAALTIASAAPFAANDQGTTSEETLVSLPVLVNDSDPNDDPLTIASVGAPAHGSAGSYADTVVYSPTLDFHGTDSLTYTISDGVAVSRPATVTITVEPRNDAPIFTSTAVSSASVNLPYRYLITARDVDAADTLTITALLKPSWLTLTDQGDGTAALGGTPGADDVGSHSIQLQVTDQDGAADTQEFVIVVNPPPQKQQEQVSRLELSITSHTSSTREAEPIDIPQVHPGDRLLYTVLITNTGPAAAQAVTLTVTLPEGVAYQTVTQAAEAHQDEWQCRYRQTDHQIDCNAPMLEVGSLSAIIIETTVTAEDGDLRATAQVTAATLPPNSHPVRAEALVHVSHGPFSLFLPILRQERDS